LEGFVQPGTNIITFPGNSVLSRRDVTAQSIYWLGYGLVNLGSIPGRRWEFFSSSPRTDLLWGPPSLLSSGYRGFFLRV